MKKMLAEFKTFISKGNVLDMAIGVIIALNSLKNFFMVDFPFYNIFLFFFLTFWG